MAIGFGIGANMSVHYSSRLRQSAAFMILIWFPFVATATNQQSTYKNAEYGLQVEVPLVYRVCAAKSGGHPVGFYIWLGQQTNCNLPKPPRIRSISFTAAYNASFEVTPGAGYCRDGVIPWRSAIDLRGLTFPGRRSVRCASRRTDGAFEIFVATQGGKPLGQDLPPEIAAAPGINYYAVLRTRPERLKEDIVTFRGLLSRATIRPR